MYQSYNLAVMIFVIGYLKAITKPRNKIFLFLPVDLNCFNWSVRKNIIGIVYFYFFKGKKAAKAHEK